MSPTHPAERIAIVRHLLTPTQVISGNTEQRAQLISDEIAHLIRQCPEQYLWGYNRYKRPRGVDAPPERN